MARRRRHRRRHLRSVGAGATRRACLRLVPRLRRRRHQPVRERVRGRRLPAARRAASSRDACGVTGRRNRRRAPLRARRATRRPRDTALVPHAEADVRIVGQVARHAQRLAGVTRMRREELDDLARCGAAHQGQKRIAPPAPHHSARTAPSRPRRLPRTADSAAAHQRPRGLCPCGRLDPNSRSPALRTRPSARNSIGDAPAARTDRAAAAAVLHGAARARRRGGSS